MKNLINTQTLVRCFIIVNASLFLFSCVEEEPTVNYRDVVYTQNDLEYQFDVVYGNNSNVHIMDVYMPVKNKATDKPVVLLSGGGNFGPISKAAEVKFLAKSLAKRGYVTAFVNFTRVNNDNGVYPPSQFTLNDVTSAFSQGMFDLKAAIRYFKINSAEYGIDPDRVIVGGWSTAAHLALAAATMENEAELNEIQDEMLRTSYSTIVSDAGGIEGNSGSDGPSSDVLAVLALMPQTVDPQMIDQDDPPMFLMSHEASFGFNESFNQISIVDDILVKVKDHTYISYGHHSIADQAEAVGMDYEEHILTNQTDKPNATPLNAINFQAMANFIADRLN